MYFSQPPHEIISWWPGYRPSRGALYATTAKAPPEFWKRSTIRRIFYKDAPLGVPSTMVCPAIL